MKILDLIKNKKQKKLKIKTTKTKKITFTENQVRRIVRCLEQNNIYFHLNYDGSDYLEPEEKALIKKTENIKRLLYNKLNN